MAKRFYGTESMTKKNVEKLFTELKQAFNHNCMTVTTVLKNEAYDYSTRKWAISHLKGVKDGLTTYVHIKSIWCGMYRDFDAWADHQITRLEVRWDNKFIEVG